MTVYNKEVPVTIPQNRAIFRCDFCKKEVIGTSHYTSEYPDGWWRLTERSFPPNRKGSSTRRLYNLDLCSTGCMQDVVNSLALYLDIDPTTLRDKPKDEVDDV